MKLKHYVALLLILGGIGLYANQTKADIYGSSLVGWYTMDSNHISGTTVTDLSGTGNTGTTQNSPTLGLGRVGQALKLNGTNQYVSFASSTSFSAITSTATVAAWVNWTASTEAYNNIAGGYGPNPSGWELLVKSNQKLAWYVNNSSGFIDGGGTSIPFGQWTHIVGTYDGSNLRTYINGVVDQTFGYVGAIGSQYIIPYIGHDQFGTGRYFKGSIDDVRFYNRALSAGEVMQLYQSGKGLHLNTF